jgi:hypothetical protein
MNIAIMTEAASISETSVYFYQTSRSNIPEDSHFYGENLSDIFIGINLLSVLRETSWTLVQTNVVAVLYETSADCPSWS